MTTKKVNEICEELGLEFEKASSEADYNYVIKKGNLRVGSFQTIKDSFLFLEEVKTGERKLPDWVDEDTIKLEGKYDEFDDPSKDSPDFSIDVEAEETDDDVVVGDPNPEDEGNEEKEFIDEFTFFEESEEEDFGV